MKLVTQLLEALIPQQLCEFRDIIPLWHGNREGVRAFLAEDLMEVARIVHFYAVPKERKRMEAIKINIII